MQKNYQKVSIFLILEVLQEKLLKRINYHIQQQLKTRTMKRVSSIIIICMISLSVFAQKSTNYKKASLKPDANYYEIVKSVRNDFSKRDLSKLSNKKAQKQFERWAYFWRDRVNADGSFPNPNLGYYNAGILDKNGKIVNRKDFRRAPNALVWENIGPQQLPAANGYTNYPQMGRLDAFLRLSDPNGNQANDVLFVGAPSGGIWKSTDNGTTWLPVLDEVAGIGVTDIASAAPNYSANAIIYVSTGSYDGSDGYNKKSIGILKSTDGGSTFQSTGYAFNLNNEVQTSNLVVLDDNTVIVASSQDIFKTTDGGQNWNVVYHAQFPKNFGKFVHAGNTIWCMAENGDVFQSTNAGALNSWVQIRDMTNSPDGKLALAVHNNQVYILNNFGEVHKLIGANWVQQNAPVAGFDNQGGYDEALVVDGTRIIAGGVDGFHSTDNGQNWYKSLNGYWYSDDDEGTYMHSDIHNMGKLDDQGNYWSCNDGGLSFINYANAATQKPVVTYKSEGCIVTQSYSVAITPNGNSDNMLLGNQDNDGFSKELHNGQIQWIAVMAGDGTATAIDYTDANIRFLGGTSGNLGITLHGYSGHLDGEYGADIPGAGFIWPLEMNTTNHNLLYAGGDNVYKLDMANNRTVTSLNANTGEVSFISTHNNAIFAVGYDAVRKSVNGGTTWSNINQANANNEAEINSIDFNQDNTNIVYATCKRYVDGEKVFKSVDGGQTWSNISQGLPNIVMYEVLLVQNNQTEILYLATELGVYYKIGNADWEKLDDATLPNVIIYDIDMNYTENKLVAASYGRGLWQIDVSSQTASVNENLLKDNVSLYPIPTKDLLNIKLSDNLNDNYNYSIYNVVGGLFKKGKLMRTNTIDISNLPQGIYIFKMTDGKNSYAQKIIKE